MSRLTLLIIIAALGAMTLRTVFSITTNLNTNMGSIEHRADIE